MPPAQAGNRPPPAAQTPSWNRLSALNERPAPDRGGAAACIQTAQVHYDGICPHWQTRVFRYPRNRYQGVQLLRQQTPRVTAAPATRNQYSGMCRKPTKRRDTLTRDRCVLWQSISEIKSHCSEASASGIVVPWRPVLILCIFTCVRAMVPSRHFSYGCC
jgi:hypothetical protein